MGAYNIVNPADLVSGQPEDISQVLANFQAIQAILNGGIDNSNINAAAAIAYSKLMLANSILNADISPAAAIAIAKLAGYPANGAVFLAGDGTWKAASSITYRRTIAVTVNNSVAEVDLLGGGVTVAAGAIGPSGVIRLTAWGDLLSNNGIIGVNQWKLKLGATTLIDTANPGANFRYGGSATRYPWRLVAEIMNLGAANSQLVSFLLTYQSPLNNVTSLAMATGEGYTTSDSVPTLPEIIAQGFNTAAVDTTVADALVLSVIQSAASVNQETKCYGALVEII
jgi:hypothetical protein